MIAFEVKLNGKRLAIAGIPGYAVLSAILSWVRRSAGRAKGITDLTFSLGGLDSNRPRDEGQESISWLNLRLSEGDKISLTILDRETVDPPQHSE